MFTDVGESAVTFLDGSMVGSRLRAAEEMSFSAATTRLFVHLKLSIKSVCNHTAGPLIREGKWRSNRWSLTRKDSMWEPRAGILGSDQLIVYTEGHSEFFQKSPKLSRRL
jgi:hypothetical protein